MYLGKSVQKGFTILEVLIAVAIIGILVAIALPNYQDYVRRTKRADMMAEMQNIAKTVESRKMAAGRSRSQLSFGDLNGKYPRNSTQSYTVAVITTPIAGVPKDTSVEKWVIKATPLANTTQASDGELRLMYNGAKCRGNKCGMSDEWRN